MIKLFQQNPVLDMGRFFVLSTFGIFLMISQGDLQAQSLPDQSSILESARLANDYFMQKWPDPGMEIVGNKVRPSNIWTRAVYYEGLMGLYEIDPRAEYLDYAVDWGNAHDWKFRGGKVYTRYADHHCAAQTYIDLYRIDPQPERIKYTTLSIDSMMNTNKIDDWHWIDALQMGMPVFAKLGVLKKDDAYLERMYEMYAFAKTKHGDNGLYNKKDKLWWRDKDFDPPYKEPNGEDCYWSRGNGWVIMALAKTLAIIPQDAPHRNVYKKDLKRMAKAITKVQRADGFWNVSLHDPGNYGGKETTGTAMFVYAMAWGINNGLLSKRKYQPVVINGWNAMVKDALHDNGFLGYVQGTGKEPKDGQPLSYDKVPDFEDYGLGAFLLAAVEMHKMSAE